MILYFAQLRTHTGVESGIIDFEHEAPDERRVGLTSKESLNARGLANELPKAFEDGRVEWACGDNLTEHDVFLLAVDIEERHDHKLEERLAFLLDYKMEELSEQRKSLLAGGGEQEFFLVVATEKRVGQSVGQFRHLEEHLGEVLHLFEELLFNSLFGSQRIECACVSDRYFAYIHAYRTINCLALGLPR